jgi:23S rRNA (cytidine1920-2'-O)/16S rRNA (cytidine1409-2'-O)-methyltransferase
MERTNARYLTELPEKPDFVCGDLSFISLKLIIPSAVQWIASGARLVFLVKPQFEARREEVPEGGLVLDPDIHRRVLMEVLESARASGLRTLGVLPSPIRGGDGNIEYLAYFDNHSGDSESFHDLINRAIVEGQALPRN